MNRRSFIKAVGIVALAGRMLLERPVFFQALKLKAVWSEEADENLRMMHDLRFEKYIMPVVKPLMTDIRAEDFIEVQPMTFPSAQTFYLDYKYERSWRRWLRRLIRR